MSYFPWKTVGHTRQKEELERNILEKNFAPVYLFSGPSGIGKLYFAKEVIRAILCPNNLCRTCSVCRHIDTLTNPDVLVLDTLYRDPDCTDFSYIAEKSNVPQNHRAQGNKAKTNTIDIETIRNIQSLIQEKPFGPYRICLISHIDRLNDEASNTLLKTFEEPPKNVIFFLTTSKESRILDTLLSRTRVIRFNTLPNEVIQEKLEEIQPSRENEALILELAQGRSALAFEMAKNPEILKTVKNKFDEIASIYKQDSLKKKYTYIEQIAENRDFVQEFFEYSFYYLRSLLHKESAPFIIEMIKDLEYTERVIQQNVSKKLALEYFFLKYHQKLTGSPS